MTDAARGATTCYRLLSCDGSGDGRHIRRWSPLEGAAQERPGMGPRLLACLHRVPSHIVVSIDIGGCRRGATATGSATGAEACVATATLPQGAMRMSIFDYMRAALRPEVASSIFLFAVRCPCFGSLLRPLQVFLVGLIANAAAGGLVRGAKGTGHGGGN